MSDSEGVRAMTCPSCGAQIHAAEGQYRTTCEYCGALLELPHPSQPDASPTIVGLPKDPSRAAGRPRSRSWQWVLITLSLVLLGVGGLAAYLVLQVAGRASVSGIRSAVTFKRVSLPALVVPGNEAGQLDVFIYTRDSSNDTQFLSYVDGSTGALRWQSDPLGDDSYRASLAVGDKLAIAVVKTRVMAFDRATGAIAWEASVSDEIPYSCPRACLRLVGQRVVVLSRDGRLVGLDLVTGRVVWTARLNSTPDQLFMVGDRIAVFDNREDGVVLSVIDPDDGSQQMALNPKCVDPSSGFTDDPDLNSQVLVAPDQKSLVVLFGFFSSCVQRWDVSSGSLMWNAQLGDVAFMHAIGPSSIILGDSIYVAAENQLVTVDLTDGSWRVLIDDPDYEFVPLAAQEDIVIARAKRTRGTTRFELWGINASTGEREWEHPIPESEPLDAPDRMSGLVDKADSGWTAHVTPAGLIVVVASAQPHQLTAETLDPQTGTGSGTTVIPLSGITGNFYAVPDVVAWMGDRLWLIVDGRMHEISTAESQLEYVWP